MAEFKCQFKKKDPFSQILVDIDFWLVINKN